MKRVVMVVGLLSLAVLVPLSLAGGRKETPVTKASSPAEYLRVGKTYVFGLTTSGPGSNFSKGEVVAEVLAVPSEGWVKIAAREEEHRTTYLLNLSRVEVITEFPVAPVAGE